jgi:uncharacterized protein (TIGR02996 family)
MNAEAFDTQVIFHPEDTVLRLAFADFLEENGEVDFANTQRWMVSNGIYLPPISHHGYCWYSPQFKPQGYYTLSDEVYESLGNEFRFELVQDHYFKAYKTLRAAEIALMVGLKACEIIGKGILVSS